MKTSKQLSQDVFEKIAKREEQLKKRRKQLKIGLTSFVVMLCLLPLTSLFFFKPTAPDRNAPLTTPYSSDEQTTGDEGVPAEYFTPQKYSVNGF
ncbi:MAG: hypothetical protein IKD47_00290 [Clostridia bacterium]|nr:hypothetical protein [Clostridia bacterium]